MKKLLVICGLCSLIMASSPLLAGNGTIYLSRETSLDQVNRWTMLGSGGIAALEATSLLIGMNVSGSDWATPENMGIAATDILLGGALIYNSLGVSNYHSSPVFYAIASLFVLSHAYREWGYLSGQKNPYCLNKPLFILNSLQIVAGMGTIGMSITLAI